MAGRCTSQGQVVELDSPETKRAESWCGDMGTLQRLTRLCFHSGDSVNINWIGIRVCLEFGALLISDSNLVSICL